MSVISKASIAAGALALAAATVGFSGTASARDHWHRGYVYYPPPVVYYPPPPRYYYPPPVVYSPGVSVYTPGFSFSIY